MAPSNPADDADHGYSYIMLVLSTLGVLKPDYHEVARKAGICDANTAQKKFKNFVEQGGYALEKGAVVRTDKAPPLPDRANIRDTSSNKYRSKDRSGRATKKRKHDTIEERGDKDETIRDETAKEEA